MAHLTTVVHTVASSMHESTRVLIQHASGVNAQLASLVNGLSGVQAQLGSLATMCGEMLARDRPLALGGRGGLGPGGRDPRGASYGNEGDIHGSWHGNEDDDGDDGDDDGGRGYPRRQGTVGRTPKVRDMQHFRGGSADQCAWMCESLGRNVRYSIPSCPFPTP